MYDFMLLAAVVLMVGCSGGGGAKVLSSSKTNCGNTAKWFNSTGKSLKVTVKGIDNCATKESSASFYESESDIGPPIEAIPDKGEKSFDREVPNGGYVKLTCNGEGTGDCTLIISERN